MAVMNKNVSIEHVHEYKLSLKAVTGITLIISVILTALFSFLEFPPSIGTFNTNMYFHAIGIGIAAMLSFLVLSIYDLEKYVPPLDFPLRYRALFAVLLSAFSALFYLIPGLNTSVPDVAIALFIIAFLFIGDVGGALLLEMLMLPRKLNGTFNLKNNYIGKIFPTSMDDLASYKKMDVAYWLVVLSILSAVIAGIIGFVNLWVLLFGASFFSGYISFLGIDVDGFLEATLDPHSHEMALSLMAGTVAIVAKHYGLTNLEALKKRVGQIGLWISSLGVIAMTITFVYIAAANYEPPTLFASGEANGIAGDDVVMSIIAIGALIALIPLALTKFKLGETETYAWKDTVRVSILGTWIAAIILNIIEAFYIEMNEDKFTSTLASNDEVFAQIQPTYGIFMLTAVAIFLLIADYYRATGLIRTIIGCLGGIGFTVSLIGVSLWAFVNPAEGSFGFILYIVGAIIIGISAVGTIFVIYKSQ